MSRRSASAWKMKHFILDLARYYINFTKNYMRNNIIRYFTTKNILFICMYCFNSTIIIVRLIL